MLRWRGQRAVAAPAGLGIALFAGKTRVPAGFGCFSDVRLDGFGRKENRPYVADVYLDSLDCRQCAGLV